MGTMNFLSFGELQTSTNDISEMLTDSGNVIVTSNGKPAAFMIAIDESSLEETLNDWQQIRVMRSLRKLQKHAEQNGLAAITLDDDNTKIAETRKPRPVFGSGKGLMWIADDFDAPLDELREYME